MSSLITDGALVLFQGDSITDAGRDRSDDADLGRGYALFAAARFQAEFPGKRVRFLNRGMGGHRVADLQERWQRDCIALKPDWVSLMIGINDCWRRYDSGDPTSTAAFEAAYRDLLERVQKVSPARLILLEPFVLPHPADRKAWREDLDPKIDVARRLAREFKAFMVPTDGLFAAACARAAPEFWASDGVHPSPAGHALIAQAWLDAVMAP